MSSLTIADPRRERSMMLGALRYFMGRERMVVASFCQTLIELQPQLERVTKEAIARELKQAIRTTQKDHARGVAISALGDPQDKEPWLMVWEKYQVELQPPEEVGQKLNNAFVRV